jgi:hypothetical protein
LLHDGVHLSSTGLRPQAEHICRLALFWACPRILGRKRVALQPASLCFNKAFPIFYDGDRVDANHPRSLPVDILGAIRILTSLLLFTPHFRLYSAGAIIALDLMAILI